MVWGKGVPLWGAHAKASLPPPPRYQSDDKWSLFREWRGELRKERETETERKRAHLAIAR